MSPAQQAALAALMGRGLTQDETAALEPLLDTNNRNDTAITGIINAGQPGIVGGLSVEDVFDTLFSTGDYLVLKTAQMAGDPVAAMAFATLYDAKQIGKNIVSLSSPTTALSLDQLQASGLLGVTGREALTARATVKVVTRSVEEVSGALNIAENRMML